MIANERAAPRDGRFIELADAKIHFTEARQRFAISRDHLVPDLALLGFVRR